LVTDWASEENDDDSNSEYDPWWSFDCGNNNQQRSSSKNVQDYQAPILKGDTSKHHQGDDKITVPTFFFGPNKLSPLPLRRHSFHRVSCDKQ